MEDRDRFAGSRIRAHMPQFLSVRKHDKNFSLLAPKGAHGTFYFLIFTSYFLGAAHANKN